MIKLLEAGPMKDNLFTLKSCVILAARRLVVRGPVS